MVKSRTTSRFAKPLGGTRCIADVVFGVADRDCAGFGICKIEPKGQTVRPACRGRLVVAEIYPASPTGVGLWINRDDISPLMMERYFAFDYFVIEQDFAIPPTIWQRYGEAQVIHKGYYPIDRQADHFQIIFSTDSNLLSTLK